MRQSVPPREGLSLAPDLSQAAAPLKLRGLLVHNTLRPPAGEASGVVLVAARAAHPTFTARCGQRPEALFRRWVKQCGEAYLARRLAVTALNLLPSEFNKLKPHLIAFGIRC
jgi:hypothetical protein